MLSITEISLPYLSVLLLLLLICRAIYAQWIRNKTYPPGPTPIPFLGNVLQLPLEYQERTFWDWRNRFGDIIYARFFQTPTIIINSAEVAQDLLERRSSNYSDRPHFTLQAEMMNWKDMLVHIPYGDKFRKMRKWIHDAFMTKAALAQYRPIQLRETSIVLAGLLAQPNNFVSHFTRFTAATITEITYGHTVTSLDDKFIYLADKAAGDTVEAGSPGSMLVDFVPILKYYPTWLPGSGWKVNALSIREIGRQMVNVPYDSVKESMTSGKAKPCFVSSLLEGHYQRGCLTEEDEHDIKSAAAVLYGAGTETTATVLTAFILAMVKYPEVFKKARSEIDRVIGSDRLPDFEDRDSLPYLDCVIKEVYRWHAPTPLGIPHLSMKDDVYKGHVIPAQSMMIANIWGISRNTEYYPNPEEFIPERYEGLDKERADLINPRDLVFGYGRRQCPAQNFADCNVYLVAANIIATMDISRATDEQGVEIIPPHAFKSGFVHHILPFKCRIRPRSQKVVNLIAQLNAASTA